MSNENTIHAEAPLSAPEGHVTNAKLSGGRIYTGEVSEDCMHGSGTLTTELDEHTGNFFKNLPHGHGVFRASVDPHPSGVQMYDGDWHMGERHGAGRITWSNGDTYTGGFAHNLPHGAGGRYAFADGRVYVGDFKEGVRHGGGRLTQRGGDYYDGAFVRGTMRGRGTASYAGGRRVFVGEWANGKKLHGRITFADSRRMYDGEWLREKPHGSGEMVFANGDHYAGAFVAGQLHGVGCITYHSLGGKVYRGTFMHDQPHGKGIITTPDGNSVEGYFRHGKQIAKEDTDAIEEVLRDVSSLGEEAAAVVNQDKLGENSTPASVGSTQPPSAQSSGDNIEEAYISIQNGKNGHNNNNTKNNNNKNNNSNNDNNNKNDVNVKEKVTSEINGHGMNILSPGIEENVTEVMIPKLPSLNPSGPLDEVKGSTSNPSKEEEKEILAVSASVISGIASDGCKGWLEKFSIGRSRIGRSNWRRRYFVLASFNTVVCLSYYKDELCRSPVTLLRLDTHDTRIVTRPSLRTHKEATKPGRDICVIYVEHRKEYKLLLRADSEDEHDFWVDAFRKLFDIIDYPSDFPLLSSSPE